MAKFTLNKSLPSTRVTRDVVRSLETYIAQKTAALAALLESRKTTIKDDHGTEQLGTIDERALTLFSDATTEVKVEFSSYETSLGRLTIDVNFSLERIHSIVWISLEGPNAREVAVGLYAGIRQCVDTSPARNGLFHPPAFWQGVLVALPMGIFATSGLVSRFVSNGVYWVLMALGLTLFMLWFVAPKIRTYNVFDSDRANRRGRAWDWLFKGSIGFLLFGTVLALARDRIAEWFR
jgi:hypothetical protein